MANNIQKFASAVTEPFREDPIEKAKRECTRNGGRWENNRCVLPAEDTVRKANEAVANRTPEQEAIKRESDAGIIGEVRGKEGLQLLPKEGVFKEGDVVTDSDTGQPTGIIRNGKFFAMDKAEIQNIVNKDLAEKTPIQGAQTARGRLETERIEGELASVEAPERRELDPITTQLEKFPIIGPGLQLLKDKFTELLGGDSRVEITEDMMMATALTEIERIEIEKGLTASEKFGTIAEALPAGELAKFIPGLSGAEKPSGNIQTRLKSIRLLKSRAVDVETKFNRGIGTVSSHTARLDQIDRELDEAEARMRVLVQGSPELKFNSDGVNFIELKILEVRERVSDSRIALIQGPSTDPTLTQVLTNLQTSIAAEDYTIPGL